jgi:hypothetical protein
MRRLGNFSLNSYCTFPFRVAQFREKIEHPDACLDGK